MSSPILLLSNHLRNMSKTRLTVAFFNLLLRILLIWHIGWKFVQMLNKEPMETDCQYVLLTEIRYIIYAQVLLAQNIATQQQNII